MQTCPTVVTRFDRLELLARRYSRVLVLGIMLFAALLYALTFYPELIGTDDTTYLVAARALASGSGLHWINVQGLPPITFQPPGFPLLLTPGAWLFPNPPELVVAAQTVGVLSALAFIPLIYWLLTRQIKLSAIASLLIALWMAVSTQTVYLATQLVMSDPSYVVFSLLAIGLVERYQQSSAPFNRWWIFSAVAVAWVATLRTAGLPLVLAAILYLLVRRQIRHAVALAVLAGALVLPWTLWTAVHGTTPYFGIYGEQFQMSQWLVDYRPANGIEDIVRRVFTNAWSHVRESMAYGLFPTLTGPNLREWQDARGLGWITWGVGLAVTALVLIGYLRSLGQKQYLIGIYVFFYVGLILLPPWVNSRNVYPIYPFLLALLVLGAERLALGLKSARREWGQVGICLILGLMIASSLSSDRHRIYFGQQFRSPQRSAQTISDWAMPQAAEWIRGNTPANALVFYQSTQKLYLYTGRQTAASVGALPYQLNQLHPDELFARIQRDVDYVITVDQFDWYPNLAAPVAADPKHFTPVFRTATQPAVTVYRVER